MSLPAGWLGSPGGLWGQTEIVETVGRGVDWRIEPLGPLPPWMLLVLAFGLVAAVVLLGLVGRRGIGPAALSMRQRLILVCLRSAALCVLVWMLGGWAIARFETELPDLVLLLDASQSMSLPGDDAASQAGVTRWEAALELLSRDEGRLLRELSKDYQLRVQVVGDPAALSAGAAASGGETLSGDAGQAGDAASVGTGVRDEAAMLLDRLATLTPSAVTSPLGDALASAARAQRGKSTAAMVMITDGVVTSGAPLAEGALTAADARLPVVMVATGSPEPPPQIAVAEVVSDSTAMVGDRVSITARVRWSGTDGSPLRLRLIDQADQTQLATKRIAAGVAAGSELVELSFLATEPGLRRLRLEADRLTGEVALEDNVRETVVEIRDESFRVLLIEGGPSYEFRFLKHLLERATNRDGSRPLVDLVSVLQQGDARYADQDRTARRLPPVDDESLNRLDLIILSDCDPAALGLRLQTRIVDLVTRGGASLVVIAGPDHLPQALSGTPLASLLPIEPSSVAAPAVTDRPLRWRVTPLGRSLPNLRIETPRDDWSAAPPIYWLATAGDLRPGARVLIETPDQSVAGRPAPIVISQLAGHGQVWLQLTDESFRLRLADPDAALYERYWLQLVRSLAKRKDAGGERTTLAIQGERFAEGRAIPFQVQLADALLPAAGDEVEIAVTDQAGQVVSVSGTADPTAGGQYRGVIEGLPPGVYRAVLTEPVGGDEPAGDSFVVESDPLEMSRTRVDLAALREAAALTGGTVLQIEEAAERLRPAIPPGRAIRVRPLPPIPIWNHPLAALLLFASLGAEWILRRRWGSV